MPEKDPIQLKIDALTDEELKRGLDAFLAAVDPSLAVTLNSCVRCGLCASTCAYSFDGARFIVLGKIQGAVPLDPEPRP